MSSKKDRNGKKRNKNKLNLGFVYPYLRERVDIDYFQKIPPSAQMYLQKFINELYGKRFQSNSLIKDRKSVYKEVNAAEVDVASVFVRVEIDPTETELTPVLVRVEKKLKPNKD